MRLGLVLSLNDLPAPELQAGVLDGELVQLGSAYCPIDTFIGARHRAAAIASEIPAQSIAERHTAAWVYGALDRQPRRLQLCVHIHSKVRPLSSARFQFREVVLDADEVVTMGGLSVTSPLRTAVDIARIEESFSASTAQLVRDLASLGQGFNLEDCTRVLNRRRNLPHKKLALQRLTAALSEDCLG